MKRIKISIELRVTLLYFLFGFLWILFSDHLLASITSSKEQLSQIQTYKGWFYILISGIFIYFLINRYLQRQRQAEKSQYESEKRFRLAINAAQMGVFDLNLITGEVIVNDFYAAMLGYDPNHFHETHQKWIDRLHPDDRESIVMAFQDYISGKNPEYRLEFRQKTQSGNWKWILSIGSIVEWDQGGKPLRMLGTYTDITPGKNAEIEISRLYEESQRRLRRIESLHEIDNAITSSFHLDKTLDILTEKVKSELNVDCVIVLLYNPDEDVFEYACQRGFSSEKIVNSCVKYGDSLAGKAAKENRIIQLQKIDNNIDPGLTLLMAEEHMQDYYAIPLITKGRLNGVLELFHSTLLTPDKEWLHFFETLAAQTALAIENAKLIDDLQLANINLSNAYDATLQGWSNALELRERETAGHSNRVVKLTLALARIMGISEEDLRHVHRGALLHDIGKMGIPDSILLKPGPLSDEEWVIMRQHPIFSSRLISQIPYLKPALDIPYSHHENWDGSGYPQGLKGEDIPLAARIFAVVDVWDALTSERPYRPAWLEKDVKKYLKDQSGKQFDPEIVEAFLNLLETKDNQ